jgi:hypothetical protein
MKTRMAKHPESKKFNSFQLTGRISLKQNTLKTWRFQRILESVLGTVDRFCLSGLLSNTYKGDHLS